MTAGIVGAAGYNLLVRDDLRPPCLGPAAVPADRWRLRGTTHWHLVRTDWPVDNRDRFDSTRVAGERSGRPTHGIGRSPDEVADWFAAQQREIIDAASDSAALARQSGLATAEDQASSRWWSHRSATAGDDVLGLQALGGARIAHLSAYAKAVAECRCDKLSPTASSDA